MSQPLATTSPDLVAAVYELLRYTEEHRYSRGHCPEWALLRDEIRSLLRAPDIGSGSDDA
jgi:hypothetical protein